MHALRLTPAAPADAETVHAILAAAGAHLTMQGYRNWQPPYPLERVTADVAAGVVLLVREAEAETPLAAFTLRAVPVHPYVPPPWADPDAPARYLNRIAVAPEAQGRGLGRWCLSRVDELATAAGARAVRCDVLAANAGLRGFYERAGYACRALRSHSGWEFACYEKLLAG